MVPVQIMAFYQQRIDHAASCAAGLRGAADACTPGQLALRNRLLSAAQSLDDMIALAEQLKGTAQLNHDTIQDMARHR